MSRPDRRNHAAVPALWHPSWPHQLAELHWGGGVAPALLLSEGWEAAHPLTSPDRLVRAGWSFLEPPVRTTPIGPTSILERPLLLTPERAGPPPLERAEGLAGEPMAAESEWWQRCGELAQRCVVVVAQEADLDGRDVIAELDAAASRGQAVWTVARLSPVPATCRWDFTWPDPVSNANPRWRNRPA